MPTQRRDNIHRVLTTVKQTLLGASFELIAAISQRQICQEHRKTITLLTNPLQ